MSFLPRSLQTKAVSLSVSVSKKVVVSNTTACGQDDKNDDVVKASSEDQRWPSAEEPVCIICGKYGEYICDETDEDICSLKCKEIHLHLTNHQSSSIKTEVGTESVVKNDKVDCLLQITDFDRHFKESLCQVQKHLIENRHSDHVNDLTCDKLQIHVKGDNIPSLIFGFHECSFHEQLLKNLKDNNYLLPTIVQMQTIPVGLNYRDMLVSAATSSGKTASFLLPIAQIITQFFAPLPTTHIFRRFPLALIMAPTRELCMQIEEQMKAFCNGLQNIKTCILIGGNPLPQQLYRLRHKVQIIIGTPGRINDILDNHSEALDLTHIKMVVLDEVDVMLQMGFLNQIDQILQVVPRIAQTMMFSATIPSTIQQIAEKRLKNPVYISIGLSGVTNSLVHQMILWVEEVSKRKKLFSIINEPKYFKPPILVFVESKLGADMLSEAIQKKLHLSCESIHSDKTQKERSLIFHNFLTGSFKVLVTTNVMGRGLDLPNVKQVIIFDMPKTIEEYVHQVGRAGRLHKKGSVITFINKSNKNIFFPLQELCRKSGTKVPDELINSPCLENNSQNVRKIDNMRDEKHKRRKLDDMELNQKSLLQILTKHKKMK